MTGPAYPPSPLPGSNGFGEFTIGVSPIGTIIPFNFWQTIISQYANSPILTQLIADFDSYVDQTQNFDAFYDLIWNVDTAQGYGLDIWGRIVGVSRILQIPSGGTYFGFEESDAGPVGTFGQSPFYNGETTTSSYILSDDAYRTLIFAKALANICDGSIPAINQLLLNLFPGQGNCYVTDGQNMTMTYTFKFVLNPVQAAIVTQSGVLPKPVGVVATVVQL